LQQSLKSLWITFLSGDAFNIIEKPVGDKVTFLHYNPPTLQHTKDLTNEKLVFAIVIYHNGHHCIGIQILYASLVILSYKSPKIQPFLTKTKCFCNFVIIISLTPLLFLLTFFFGNFILVAFSEPPPVGFC
jgi:hypothetical protein